MSSLRSDPVHRIHPEPIDQFDRLPDSILLLVFNKIGDVKALGRCCVVSGRFHSLVPQVENVVVRVDCVISDDDSSPSSYDKSRSAGPISSIFRFLFGGIVKPFHALAQFLGPKRPAFRETLNTHPSSSSLFVGSVGPRADVNDGEMEQGGVTHHSPTQVLRNFDEIRYLRIELPSGELGIDDGVLLRWRADFGSTLDNCVILGAASVTKNLHLQVPECGNDEFCPNNNIINVDDNGSIPESFYTNGGLKLRVVWTISSLIAASARHYLLQPIIAEHKTLDSLVLTDADGQGVLCMNRDQLEELRVKPLSASSALKRTQVPALNMRLWYAPHLELPDGIVLNGATLVAIRPSEQSSSKKEVSDASWLSTAFEEPYGTAAKMLVKRKTYCLEMNSF
ncbi:F-box protein [Hibiscus syriacus]|uniref:F-box protein n=1 Tax=Hibiscus syriacus TaxID=106335 RepID=A0A6A2ZXL8_HIBSY|nr:F-box protein At5g46170-like [Hibiscus syriacus]XP_039009098.1 F-box protein At5g46170-like [Hibiscus syriacus]KAE8696473.1 F-box protein [Hibiscus syriacus]